MAKSNTPPRGGGPNKHGFQRPRNTKKTFLRLLSYLGKYKLLLVLVALCLLLSSIASVATGYLLKPILNDYIIPGDFPGLLKMLFLQGGVFIISALCSYVYSRLMVYVAQRAVATIREDLFNKMQELPVSYFDTHLSGDMMSRFTNDMDTVSEMIGNSFASLLSNVLTFVATFVMMLVMNPLLTLITVAFLFLMLLVVKTIGGKSRVNFQRQQQTLGALNGYIEEMIEGQKVIKVFSHEEKAMEAFSKLNEDYRVAGTMAQSYAGAMMPAMANLSRIDYAITCCVGGLLAIRGVFDVGSLGAYLLYVKQVSQPINGISQQVNVILAAAAGAERIFDMMDAPPETDAGKTVLVRVEKEGDTLTETQRRTGHWAWKKPDGALVELRGDVRFHDVTFSYDGEKTVLHNISLFAKPGQKIAFVGSTGAGKTTITNLINRFYDVQEGTITYDGIDVKDIAKDSLRRSLGMVLQETQLFTGTIADNIRYGKPDATDEEVRAAARLANADTFIRHLPKGYDTMLTGGGSDLSQGERQLLSIARAAVSDPPVLILDEATSSIDTRTEKLIEKGMDSLMEDRTVFVIAHRLSTVRNAQAILVLEKGEIIERGDHEALLEEKGRYYQLYTGSAELS
ncbi:MAG: ABC transporter ATP-binding protein [Oscillospiraceae bacterium]|nr:ABC transporter ATP-binding protein [Oscillospiraceae bacterium]